MLTKLNTLIGHIWNEQLNSRNRNQTFPLVVFPVLCGIITVFGCISATQLMKVEFCGK